MLFRSVNHQNAVNSFKGFFKEEEPNLEEITSEEIQELINACTNDRDRLLIAMMAETGLRLGEILGIHYMFDHYPCNTYWQVPDRQK